MIILWPGNIFCVPAHTQRLGEERELKIAVLRSPGRQWIVGFFLSSSILRRSSHITVILRSKAQPSA